MAAGAEQLDGANPLFELECGRITEERFLDILRDGLEPIIGERPRCTASRRPTSTACTRTRR